MNRVPCSTHADRLFAGRFPVSLLRVKSPSVPAGHVFPLGASSHILIRRRMRPSLIRLDTRFHQRGGCCRSNRSNPRQPPVKPARINVRHALRHPWRSVLTIRVLLRAPGPPRRWAPRLATAAICTTRSRIQGIPSGRVRLLPSWGCSPWRGEAGGDTFAGVVLPSIRPATFFAISPIRLNVTPAHARHSLVGQAAVERVLEGRPVVDLVVEGVESVVGRSLRFYVTPSRSFNLGGGRLTSISPGCMTSCVNSELGSLPSTGVTRVSNVVLRTPATPSGPACPRGLPVVSRNSAIMGFVLRQFSLCTMPSFVPRRDRWDLSLMARPIPTGRPI